MTPRLTPSLTSREMVGLSRKRYNPIPTPTYTMLAHNALKHIHQVNQGKSRRGPIAMEVGSPNCPGGGGTVSYPSSLLAGRCGRGGRKAGRMLQTVVWNAGMETTPNARPSFVLFGRELMHSRHSATPTPAKNMAVGIIMIA